MSWIQTLYDTYNACQSEIGKVSSENGAALLPIYHTTQQAHLEGAVDLEGNWLSGRGRVIQSKGERTTLIPCTEKSSARTSKPEPHPLFDKLQYMAGDYAAYAHPKMDSFPDYQKLLGDWCDSPYRHPKVCAIFRYLQKGTLICDFANDGLLYRAPDGTLPEAWNGPKEETPPVFQAIPNQLDAFVRLRVLDGEQDIPPWDDSTVWQSWIDYQNSLPEKNGVCYALGKVMPVTELSPKKIRNAGDMAKLISSNDSSGFTYRGRFDTPGEAYSIGRETTEKAHNALRWLISRQGYVNGEQVVLAFHTQLRQPPTRLAGLDTLDFCGALDLAALNAPQEPVLSTGEDFADRLNRAVAGYKAGLEGWEASAVLGLDSATPGRLSIFYYRELEARDLIDRIKHWHTTCSWRHIYRKQQQGVTEKGKPVLATVPFVGAPSPKDIAEAAYGRNLDDKLKKSVVKRLLPCIIDKAALPEDLMRCAARRAANSIALDHWEAEKTQTIACALIRKFYNDRKHKEVWTMGLITDLSGYTPQERRSYLLGRALAYADRLEALAQRAAGNDARATNAQRYRVTFEQHPKHGWEQIARQLHPYILRLDSGKSFYHALSKRYQGELAGVLDELDIKDLSNEPLSPVYHLGFASQQKAFWEESKKSDGDQPEKQAANESKGENQE